MFIAIYRNTNGSGEKCPYTYGTTYHKESVVILLRVPHTKTARRRLLCLVCGKIPPLCCTYKVSSAIPPKRGHKRPLGIPHSHHFLRPSHSCRTEAANCMLSQRKRMIVYKIHFLEHPTWHLPNGVTSIQHYHYRKNHSTRPKAIFFTVV